MARKLSPVAQLASCVLATAAVLLVAPGAPAEQPARTPAQPRPSESSLLVRPGGQTAQGSQAQRPAGAITYRNPFSADAQAPPTASALLPGSRTRWHTIAPKQQASPAAAQSPTTPANTAASSPIATPSNPFTGKAAQNSLVPSPAPAPTDTTARILTNLPKPTTPTGPALQPPASPETSIQPATYNPVVSAPPVAAAAPELTPPSTAEVTPADQYPTEFEAADEPIIIEDSTPSPPPVKIATTTPAPDRYSSDDSSSLPASEAPAPIESNTNPQDASSSSEDQTIYIEDNTPPATQTLAPPPHLETQPLESVSAESAPAANPSSSNLRLITPGPESAPSAPPADQPVSDTQSAVDEQSATIENHAPSVQPLPEPTQPLRSTLTVRDAIRTIPVPETGGLPWIAPSASDNAVRRNVATALSDIPAEASSNLDPPEPSQFGGATIREPVWLDPHVAPARDKSAVDQVAYSQSEQPATPGSLERVPAALEPERSGQPLSKTNVDETPAVWLVQAQELAGEAPSPDNLTAIIKLCEHAAITDPSPEIVAPAARLASWAHNRKGEQLIDAGQPDIALGEFEIALSIDAENPLALHNRAVTLAQQGKFDDALADFNRVIDLNPGLAIAYRNRAELFAAESKPREAIADYTQAIEREASDPELYRARAYALQQIGERERALADLDRAVQLAPGEPQGYTQRGNLLADAGQYAHAVEDFEQSLAINPDLSETHRSLAWLRCTCPEERYRDSKYALTAAQLAASLSSPDDYLALDVLAAAHANAGDFNRAVNFEHQALQRAPQAAAPPMQARLHLYQQHQPYRTTR